MKSVALLKKIVFSVLCILSQVFIFLIKKKRDFLFTSLLKTLDFYLVKHEGIAVLYLNDKNGEARRKIKVNLI